MSRDYFAHVAGFDQGLGLVCCGTTPREAALDRIRNFHGPERIVVSVYERGDVIRKGGALLGSWKFLRTKEGDWREYL